MHYLDQKLSQKFNLVILKGCGKFGPKRNADFQISPPKISQFLSSCRKGYKFQILLVSFVSTVHYFNTKILQIFYLVTLKSSGKFGPKLNANFQISPPKIGQFVSSCQKGYKFEILLVSFVWKVHSLNQRLSHKFYLVTLKECGKFGPKLNANFQIRSTKIGQFVSSCRKGYKFQILLVSFVSKVHYFNKKLLQVFYLVTLKSSGKFGPKLNANFQISPPKIGQFVSSCRKGYKFQFLLVSFVWKVHSLNEKLSQKFDLVTLKGCGKFGRKLNAAFQISPPKIGQLLSSSLIVSKLEILLVCFVWKVH